MEIINTEKYSVYPSVVKSGGAASFVITARERAFMPNGTDEYRVIFNAYNSDVIDYHYEMDHKQFITAKTKDGALYLDAQIGEEGPYELTLFRIRDGEEKKMFVTAIYALDDDLYGLRPLKGDFHTHSYRSDGTHDPATVASDYREYGYDFVTLTDHNRYAPSNEIKDAFKDVKLGLEIINGEEVHTPGSGVHIVSAGAKYSIDDVYIHESERFEKEWKEKLDEVGKKVPEQYSERYALAKWASDSIHKAGGICIFPHPFWRPGHSGAYNTDFRLTEIMLKSGFFDAFEIVGGCSWPATNMNAAFWKEFAPSMPVVGSSDSHNHNDMMFRYHFSIVFAADNKSDDIISAVRDGNSVAVYLSESNGNAEFRCFGSIRLISFANFLLRKYFPRTERIAKGEGVAMRRYLIGEEDGSLLSAMSGRVTDFYERFFGKKPVVIPSKDVLDFEEKWREVQRHSPNTRGSSITSGSSPRNI